MSEPQTYEVTVAVKIDPPTEAIRAAVDRLRAVTVAMQLAAGMALAHEGAAASPVLMVGAIKPRAPHGWSSSTMYAKPFFQDLHVVLALFEEESK